MTANEITYFQVNGFWYDIQAPAPASATNTAVFTGITGGNVTFAARLPSGFTILIADLDLGSGNSGSTALALPEITGTVVGSAGGSGGTVWELCAINSNNTPGINLVANTSVISSYLTAQNVNAGQLIYDVSFTNVTFAGENGTIQNFAFAAPTSNETVSITDPGFATLPYEGA